MVFKMKKLDYSKDTNKVVSTSLVFYINLCLFYKDQDFMIDWIWEIRETVKAHTNLLFTTWSLSSTFGKLGGWWYQSLT